MAPSRQGDDGDSYMVSRSTRSENFLVRRSDASRPRQPPPSPSPDDSPSATPSPTAAELDLDERSFRKVVLKRLNEHSKALSGHSKALGGHSKEIRDLKAEMRLQLQNLTARSHNRNQYEPHHTILPLAIPQDSDSDTTEPIVPPQQIFPDKLWKFWLEFKRSAERCANLFAVHDFYGSEGWETWGIEVDPEEQEQENNGSLVAAVAAYPDAAFEALCSLLGLDVNDVERHMLSWETRRQAAANAKQAAAAQKRARSVEREEREELNRKIGELVEHIKRRKAAPPQAPQARRRTLGGRGGTVLPFSQIIREAPVMPKEELRTYPSYPEYIQPEAVSARGSSKKGTLSAHGREFPRGVFTDTNRKQSGKTAPAVEQTIEKRASGAGTTPPDAAQMTSKMASDSSSGQHSASDLGQETQKMDSDEIRKILESDRAR